MKSSRPYLLRAIYEWIVDNDCTPFLLVNAGAPGVDVPQEFVDNDKIILNIGPTATQGLVLGDEGVTFNARFSGKPRSVNAPIEAVLAIYARENGQGMLFTDETVPEADSADTEPADTPAETDTNQDATAGEHQGDDAPRPRRPNLRVIK